MRHQGQGRSRGRRTAQWVGLILALVLTAAACGDDGGDPARVTDVLNPSGTPGASASPSASATPHGSATPSASATPYGSATPTAHATAPATHAPTAVATPTAAATPAVTVSPTEVATDLATGVSAADMQAAMDAWAVVFDSTAEFADKAPHLEDAAALESINAAYAEAGESFGGFSMEPTAVDISGDEAIITYNVLFGGNAAYEDLTGEIQRVDGTWTVSREAYCGFLASARTPCS